MHFYLMHIPISGKKMAKNIADIPISGQKWNSLFTSFDSLAKTHIHPLLKLQGWLILGKTHTFMANFKYISYQVESFTNYL